MSRALSLAQKGAGFVSPNPMVGCVIVSAEGKLIGQGYHKRYGQDHAEVNAIKSLKKKSDLKDATLYVTLEPCTHHGNTPPCAEELGKLPLKRVVVAMIDPTPKVNGKGVQYLREQGLEVDVGLKEEEAKRLNEFFLHYQSSGRPFVTLKMAQTADGYIAAPDGDSQWITGKEARKLVHQWRSKYDAVMVGKNTALYDNPRLTVRHVEGRQPRRVVVDGAFDLPENLNLFADQYEEKTIIVTYNKKKVESEADPALSLLQRNYFRGDTVLVSEKDGHCNLTETMRELGRRNIISVLVEAGQSLATALLTEKLVDKLELFIAPKLLGGGTRSLLGLDIHHMNEILTFREFNWQKVGQDMLLTAYL